METNATKRAMKIAHKIEIPRKPKIKEVKIKNGSFIKSIKDHKEE